MSGNMSDVTDHVKGESIALVFDPANVPSNLSPSADDFTWRLLASRAREQTLLSSNDTAVSTRFVQGQLIVDIDPETTADFQGTVAREQLTYDPDGDDIVRKWGADFRLNEH